MSRKYKFKNPEGIYVISFATVDWIDVLPERDIPIFSRKATIQQKEKPTSYGSLFILTLLA